jgi:uncharacterized membrane protein YhhN
MKTRTVIAAVVAAACIALVLLLSRGHGVAAIAAKFVASTAFLALAIHAGAFASLYGRLVLAGLALSWCGDMFLTSQAREAFLAGLGAFLLAHVAYLAAFTTRGLDRRWLFVAAVPIAITAVFVGTWLGPYTPPDMAIPVRTYIVVISLMVVFAVATHGASRAWLIVGGAIAFYLSDLSVASLRLVQTEYATYVVGLPLYYGAQVCLALSVSQSRSH